MSHCAGRQRATATTARPEQRRVPIGNLRDAKLLEY